MSSESDNGSVELPQWVFDTLAGHARECAPEECCGFLIGARSTHGGRRVRSVLAANNASRGERERRYSIAPLEVLAAVRRARADGLEILGYYHSHPSGSATPSALDRSNAWPNTSYLILGMQGGEVREVKSWRLGPDETGFVEEAVHCQGRQP